MKIFVHIPKNGGMTIRRNPRLRDKVILATPEMHINPKYTKDLHRVMKENGEHHGNEHARWVDWNKSVRESHQAFAIVRNPWSRVVSRYEFAKKVIYKEEGSDHYGETDYVDCSSFEAFLETRHIWGNKEFFWHRAIRGWYPAFDYVSDETGKVRCDILRFENYSEDIRQYLGVLFNPEPRNVTGYRQSSYREYYDENTIQIVADWYKKDIDYWGFDFDSGAKRNYWI
jgi:hypothetical protein